MTMCRRALDERTSLAKQLGEELRASEERRIANEVEHQDMEKELSRRYQSLKTISQELKETVLNQKEEIGRLRLQLRQEERQLAERKAAQARKDREKRIHDLASRPLGEGDHHSSATSTSTSALSLAASTAGGFSARGVEQPWWARSHTAAAASSSSMYRR